MSCRETLKAHVSEAISPSRDSNLRRRKQQRTRTLSGGRYSSLGQRGARAGLWQAHARAIEDRGQTAAGRTGGGAWDAPANLRLRPDSLAPAVPPAPTEG